MGAGREVTEAALGLALEARPAHGAKAVAGVVAPLVIRAASRHLSGPRVAAGDLRTAPRWNDLTAVQSEALDNMASKIARAVCGDPREVDHWHDLGGYAGLAEKELIDARAAAVKGNVTPIGRAAQDAE